MPPCTTTLPCMPASEMVPLKLPEALEKVSVCAPRVMRLSPSMLTTDAPADVPEMSNRPRRMRLEELAMLPVPLRNRSVPAAIVVVPV